jgi:hypothetical protein
MDKLIDLFTLPLGIALFVVVFGVLYLLAKGSIDVEFLGAKITSKSDK